MDTHNILEKVRTGEISVEEAEQYFKREPFEEMGYAKLDSHRAIRSGFPEVVYCSGKGRTSTWSPFTKSFLQTMEKYLEPGQANISMRL